MAPDKALGISIEGELCLQESYALESQRTLAQAADSEISPEKDVHMATVHIRFLNINSHQRDAIKTKQPQNMMIWYFPATSMAGISNYRDNKMTVLKRLQAQFFV